jgi:hypothetical protein
MKLRVVACAHDTGRLVTSSCSAFVLPHVTLRDTKHWLGWLPAQTPTFVSA